MVKNVMVWLMILWSGKKCHGHVENIRFGQITVKQITAGDDQ